MWERDQALPVIHTKYIVQGTIEPTRYSLWVGWRDFKCIVWNWKPESSCNPQQVSQTYPTDQYSCQCPGKGPNDKGQDGRSTNPFIHRTIDQTSWGQDNQDNLLLIGETESCHELTKGYQGNGAMGQGVDLSPLQEGLWRLQLRVWRS